MVIKCLCKIRKANKSGMGFIQFKKNLSNDFEIGSSVNILIKCNSQLVSLFGRIRVYDYKGIYISRKVTEKYNLIGKEIKAKIIPIEGFFTEVDRDGKIYFPIDIAEKLNLKQDTIIKMKLQIEGLSSNLYSRIDTRLHHGSKEYYTFLGPKYYGKSAVIKTSSLSQVNPKKSEHLTLSILKGLNFSLLENEEAIIIEKHKPPLIITTQISYDDLAHYFGAYFADGTKKGNGWAICASTFEQAKYYLEMHKKIVKNSSPNFSLSFTNHKGDYINTEELLRNHWLKRAGVSISGIWFRPSNSFTARKFNKYGTLIIRENRLLVLNLYNRLLNGLLNYIYTKKNRELAIRFILGVFEGDGASNANKRGHVQIATNPSDMLILEKVLNISKLRYRAVTEKNGKCYIRIGALEFIKNMPSLYKLIFNYYPKRRKIFFTRLINTETAQFILGARKSINSWIKAEFRKNKMLNSCYKLTEKGNKMMACLQQVQKEISHQTET